MKEASCLDHNYVLIEKTGTGNYSDVYRAAIKGTDIPVAIKAIKKESTSLSQFEREVKNLSNINHPFIVKMFDYFEDSEHFYIVFEFVQGCTLLKYINEHGPVSIEGSKYLFTQLVFAMHYYQTQMHLVHRDFKCENIIVDSNLDIRIIDFGLGREFVQDNSCMKTRCGSIHYVSPEIIKGNGYSEKAEIWSLGIVLYALQTKKMLFAGENYNLVMNQILDYVPYFEHMNKDTIEVLTRMMDKNDQTRISIEELLDSQYVKSSKFYNAIEEGINAFQSISQASQNNISITEKVIFRNRQLMNYREVMSLHEAEIKRAFKTLSISSKNTQSYTNFPSHKPRALSMIENPKTNFSHQNNQAHTPKSFKCVGPVILQTCRYSGSLKKRTLTPSFMEHTS